MLTAEEVRKLFDYSPDTGELRWKVSKPGRQRAGNIAGKQNIRGYRDVGINNIRYRAHRVIWLYVTGAWPTGQIDHINGVRNDNRFANLRDVTHAQNQQNLRGPRRPSESGYLGVSWIKNDGIFCWQAVVSVNKRNFRSEPYLLPSEAYDAYLKMKRELHEGCTI